MNNLGDSFNRSEQGERQTQRASLFFKLRFQHDAGGTKKKSEKAPNLSVQDINTSFERTQKRNFTKRMKKKREGSRERDRPSSRA